MSNVTDYDVYFGSEVDEEGNSFRVGVKLKWNYTNDEIIRRKGFGKELNTYMAKTFAGYCDRYVPYLTGRLSRSKRVYARKTDMGRVVWIAKYAEAQYKNYPNKGKEFHPLATRFWDKVAWQNHGKTVVRKVDDERRRLARERSV